MLIIRSYLCLPREWWFLGMLSIHPALCCAFSGKWLFMNSLSVVKVLIQVQRPGGSGTQAVSILVTIWKIQVWGCIYNFTNAVSGSLECLSLTFQASTCISAWWPRLSFLPLSEISSLTWDTFPSGSFTKIGKLLWKVSILRRTVLLMNSHQVLYKTYGKSNCSLPPCSVTSANSKAQPWTWDEQLNE